jgi:hypothetical protein
MGTRNTAEQQRGYMATYRDRLRKAGLVPVEVWCRPEHKARVREYARALAENKAP